MSSELAIRQYGSQLAELRQACEDVLVVTSHNRELIYGRFDLRNPANSEWQLLEGRTQTDAETWQDGQKAEVVVMDFEDDEDKIAAARSIAAEQVGYLTFEADYPDNDICHVVDRFTAQPQSDFNDGGHVGISEMYDPGGKLFITVTNIGINGLSSYMHAHITTVRGEINDVIFVELDEEDLAVVDHCKEVFGQNSAAAALIEGGSLGNIDIILDKIREGAEGIVPEAELDDLLAKVRERTAKNERERLGFNGVTEERLTRIREFIADL